MSSLKRPVSCYGYGYSYGSGCASTNFDLFDDHALVWQNIFENPFCTSIHIVAFYPWRHSSQQRVFYGNLVELATS